MICEAKSPLNRTSGDRITRMEELFFFQKREFLPLLFSSSVFISPPWLQFGPGVMIVVCPTFFVTPLSTKDLPWLGSLWGRT